MKIHFYIEYFTFDFMCTIIDLFIFQYLVFIVMEPLLHVIQKSSIYSDSKMFVVMKMKYIPNKTMNLFLDVTKN